MSHRINISLYVQDDEYDWGCHIYRLQVWYFSCGYTVERNLSKKSSTEHTQCMFHWIVWWVLTDIPHHEFRKELRISCGMMYVLWYSNVLYYVLHTIPFICDKYGIIYCQQEDTGWYVIDVGWRNIPDFLLATSFRYAGSGSVIHVFSCLWWEISITPCVI